MICFEFSDHNKTGHIRQKVTSNKFGLVSEKVKSEPTFLKQTDEINKNEMRRSVD